MHVKFALRPHHEENKDEEERKKPQDENIMSASATQGGHNKTQHLTSGLRYLYEIWLSHAKCHSERSFMRENYFM